MTLNYWTSGGVDTKQEMSKPSVLEWLRQIYETSKITASVCSGARLLGKLGLLDSLAINYPKTIIDNAKRFIDTGKIMTAAGISAGIDLSLHIVEKLYGVTIKNKTIVYMEYGDWENLL